ncbi:hypothetical protein LJB99_06930 [Deltaproteobacteria bacterium OttesenSCG-928-K17]|nr:hypothetical protein [Deltaproteobacteria bacterium OttesenSCG-928-K17]
MKINRFIKLPPLLALTLMLSLVPPLYGAPGGQSPEARNSRSQAVMTLNTLRDQISADRLFIQKNAWGKGRPPNYNKPFFTDTNKQLDALKPMIATAPPEDINGLGNIYQALDKLKAAESSYRQSIDESYDGQLQIMQSLLDISEIMQLIDARSNDLVYGAGGLFNQPYDDHDLPDAENSRRKPPPSTDLEAVRTAYRLREKTFYLKVRLDAIEADLRSIPGGRINSHYLPSWPPRDSNGEPEILSLPNMSEEDLTAMKAKLPQAIKDLAAQIEAANINLEKMDEAEAALDRAANEALKRIDELRVYFIDKW